MTRDYEVLMLLKATGTDAEVAQAVAQVEEPIKKLGGVIATSKPYGRRRLSYRIARHTEGYYQFIEFRLAPEQIEELKRLLRLQDTVVRFLILSRSEHPAQPTRAQAAGQARAVH